ncbi:MAG: PQQ-binding-like beta-propeller repeat protein [Chthoniobacteraceae bacterium]
MNLRSRFTVAAVFAFALCPAFAQPKKKAASPAKAEPAKAAAGVAGWISWRGPSQDGTSTEKGLPGTVDAKKPLWTADFPGQSAPVIFKGKLYINGYLGEGADKREGVTCFDAETGKQLWQHLENDFLSDIIYDRYSTGAPTIDAETGNVYVQGSQGMLSCFTADGKVVWQHSLMEEYGRLTFPNGRTASPQIDKDIVITRHITSGWGAAGPAGDRLYAFDKKTGELVWMSSPADRPQDATFAPLYFSWLDGMRVFFTPCGDSSLACVNARTGDPVFRMSVAKAGAKGGINAGVLRYKDSLLVIHESENIDTSEVGRSAAFKIPMGSKPPAPGQPQVYAAKDHELWRNPLGSLGSSPCLVGNRLFEVTGLGELGCIDADTGKILWREKLGVEQRQSSPFYADGKLYISFYTAAQTGTGSEAEGGGNGELFIIKPDDKGMKILSRTILEGRCYGSPIGYNGKLYVQTDKKLYAFGKAGANPGAKSVVFADDWAKAPKAGPAAKLQIIPNESLLHPGDKVPLRVRALDANGFTVEESVDLTKVKVESYIPPTALVKVTMTGGVKDGFLVAEPATKPSAGAFMGTMTVGGKEISGTMRGRVQLGLPIKLDFEATELNEKTGPGVGNQPPVLPPTAQPNPTNWNVIEPPTAFAYPPLPWTGARFRFEVRDAPGGGKALCKSIDHKLFQRGQAFIGHPDMKNYTIEADVMSEGNKRKLSDIGLINQRYLVVLRGNGREIEVSSNLERIKATKPFSIAPNEWYRLKVEVDVAKDGSGVVKAKAWKKGEAEPAAWLIEVPHKNAHRNGSPGFFSLTPQEQRAWIDNLTVTARN